MMAKIWITYAWDDNKHNDIGFIAQELEQAGLEVKLDRWNISAGQRLWQQIETFISSPEQSDAWLLVATDNSLASEKCEEEYAYALDRALNIRGQNYPVIALFLGSVDKSLIPAGIRTRLYVSISDPDWKERIVAAAEGRPYKTQRKQIQPFYICVHKNQHGPKPIAIEVRPRAGVWSPFFAAIPIVEKESVDPNIMIGPSDVPTNSGMLVNYINIKGELRDEKMWVMSAGNQATPTESYYIWCKSMPSMLVFGDNEHGHIFKVNFRE